MARMLMSAIGATGRDIELACGLRTWDGTGDPVRQGRLRDIAEQRARRLLKRYAAGAGRPDLWFTYHVYQKAPDWIGPLVCDALDIPYVIAEASYAPKQESGPWHAGHVQCRLGIGRADAVISLNRRDTPCLRSLTRPGCVLVDLKPFMPVADVQRGGAERGRIAGERAIPEEPPWLVCVAMMRPGDKLESFTRLSAVLQGLLDSEWHLIIVGDGSARAKVESLFAPIGERVTLTGSMAPADVYTVLKSSDLYVWPAVNEAYGMALLEAAACGLPVVATTSGGIPQIVDHGHTGLLAPEDDPAALGDYVRRMLEQPALRRRMGANARIKCRREHDVGSATEVLDGVLAALSR